MCSHFSVLITYIHKFIYLHLPTQELDHIHTHIRVHIYVSTYLYLYNPTPVCWWDTACCIWSVISSISNLHLWSSSLGLFCHIPLKIDQWNWDWRLRWDDTLNALGCTYTIVYLHISTYIHHCLPTYIRTGDGWISSGLLSTYIYLPTYTIVYLHISTYIHHCLPMYIDQELDGYPVDHLPVIFRRLPLHRGCLSHSYA